jgi:hypothetical protein
LVGLELADDRSSGTISSGDAGDAGRVIGAEDAEHVVYAPSAWSTT